MSKRSIPSLLIAVLAAAPALAAETSMKAAFVDGGRLFVADAAGTMTPLPATAGTPSLPLWSKDGTQLAFAEWLPSAGALARIHVVDPGGQALAEFPVGVERADTQVLMRGVEALEWVGAGRLAVSGTINPSTTETQVIDVSSGRVLDDVFDDGAGGAAFSASGRHVAVITGSPHFSAPGTSRPELRIDHKRVYPPAGGNVRFLSRKAWAGTSDTLAVVARGIEAGRTQLVFWSTAGVSVVPLPAVGDATAVDLSWRGREVALTVGKAVLGVDPPSGAVRPLTTGEAAAPANMADAAAGDLVARLVEEGAQQTDVWCPACTTAAPRKADFYK